MIYITCGVALLLIVLVIMYSLISISGRISREEEADGVSCDGGDPGAD